MPVRQSTCAAAAAAIIVFLANRNAFLWPMIVRQSIEQKTITLVVSSLAPAGYPGFGMVMAGTILATLPTRAVFFALQRRFAEGMPGSVKQGLTCDRFWISTTAGCSRAQR